MWFFWRMELEINPLTFREIYLIKPTVTPTLWQVVGSIGNRVKMATQEECVRWAAQLGLNYELERP